MIAPEMSLRQLRQHLGRTTVQMADRTTVTRENVSAFERRALSAYQMQALRRYVESGLGGELFVLVAIGDEVLLLVDPDPESISPRHNR